MSEAAKLTAPTRVAAERRTDALGLGTSAPRLSWVVGDAPAGWSPTTAEAESTDDDGQRETRSLNATGVDEPWPFKHLASREGRSVRVRVGGRDGTWTPWSEPLHVEAGILDRRDWAGVFIAAPWNEDTRIDQRPPLLRRPFELRGAVRRARLRTTSLGLSEVEINGSQVGDSLLSPGWSSFGHRLRYHTHDVTSMLRQESAPREVVIGVWLGDGWYRGRLGWDQRVRNIGGSTLAALVQLEIDYEDGTHDVVGSDDTWRAARGPIMRSGIYDGERVDLRDTPGKWNLPGYDDRAWELVRTVPWPQASIVAPDGPPVRVTETIRPVNVVPHDGGGVQVDFGQNIVGRVRVPLRPSTPFGIRVRHAEVMQDGELALRPLRTAEALDTVAADKSLSDETPERWAPRFTFHGFRFADIEGLTLDDVRNHVEAEVIHSDMRRTGWFRSSNPLLNRLHENVVWSMRGNFVDVPTDCPQRDERLGWTGDLQVFAPTAAFLYDCSGFLRSWMKDVAVEQRPDGSIPHFVPDVPGLDPNTGFTAVWGDVVTLTPWDLYESFGDRDMLREQYPAGRRWVEGLRSIADDETIVTSQFQFGDWLDPTAPVSDSTAAKADRHLIATAYYQRSAAVLARSARALGLDDDADRYAALAERIRRAFLERFSPRPGHLADDAQASYALAIRFGLFGSTATQDIAGEQLARLVRERGHLIGTGFAGTPAICHALAETGHLDDAYAMLLQTSSPSWLYPVTQGATTIWERWDSLKPDSRVNDAFMTSFNHYALGAVADFLHRTVAGIAPAAPGYERILFRPRPGGDLTSAGATIDTPRGTASIDWSLGTPGACVEVRVPTGATAELDLTAFGGGVHTLGPGTHQHRSEYHCQNHRTAGDTFD